MIWFWHKIIPFVLIYPNLQKNRSHLKTKANLTNLFSQEYAIFIFIFSRDHRLPNS